MAKAKKVWSYRQDVGETIFHASVMKDAAWGEYRVKFFTDCAHMPQADYHTDDLDDAGQVGVRVAQRIAHQYGGIHAGREIDIARQVAGDIVKDGEVQVGRVGHVSSRCSVPADR